MLRLLLSLVASLSLASAYVPLAGVRSVRPLRVAMSEPSDEFNVFDAGDMLNEDEVAQAVELPPPESPAEAFDVDVENASDSVKQILSDNIGSAVSKVTESTSAVDWEAKITDVFAAAIATTEQTIDSVQKVRADQNVSKMETEAMGVVADGAKSAAAFVEENEIGLKAMAIFDLLKESAVKAAASKPKPAVKKAAPEPVPEPAPTPPATKSFLSMPEAPKMPKVAMPKIAMPKVAMPKVDLPKVSMPKVTMPTFSVPKPKAVPMKPKAKAKATKGKGKAAPKANAAPEAEAPKKPDFKLPFL